MLDQLDRQIERLLRHDYPQQLDIKPEQFLAKLQPLRSRVQALDPSRPYGNIPLCIAFRAGVIHAADAMSKIQVRSANGIVDMTPLAPDDFHPIDEVALPAGAFYLLVDVDTGRNYLNVSPENALKAIRQDGRTPLTLEEGIAVTTQFPELLTDKQVYNCIQMPGSRRAGDQRVPSIWFSKGAPRLGWCWDRNIHTWLGTASAAYRLGGADGADGQATAA